MQNSAGNVFHITGRDTSRSRLAALRALRDAPGGERSRVIHVGPGPTPSLPRAAIEHITSPLGLGRFSRKAARGFPRDSAALLHIWSPEALDWCAALVQGITRRQPSGVGPRIVLDLDFPFDPRRRRDSLRLLDATCPMRYVCTSAALRNRLRKHDIGAEQCVLIRDSVEPAAFTGVDRERLRRRLDLTPEHAAILLLPPLTRQGGARIAVWGALLLAHARAGVRILMQDDGPEASRLARLVRCSRFGGLRRIAADEFTLAELLVAADLAAYTPLGVAPLWGLAWALASECPTTVSDVGVTRELLAPGPYAWLCRRNDPKDVARVMFNALEDAERSRGQAERAREKACAAFEKRRMLEQYQRVYQELFSERLLA